MPFIVCHGSTKFISREMTNELQIAKAENRIIIKIQVVHSEYKSSLYGLLKC